MVTVPADNPLITPLPVPALAIEGALLLHTPFAVTSLNNVFEPAHIAAAPVMAAGVPVTVTEIVVIEPETE